MSKLKLIDYLTINPDPSIRNLTKKQRAKILDGLFNNNPNSPDNDNFKNNYRGLDIVYDLSHSGRRINNRVYTVKGQQDGINTLTFPYPKPILTHHDGDSDPIGRFVAGQWDDLSNHALNHFKDVKDFLEVKKAFDTDDPEKIYAVMKKYNLLTAKDWPGLGRMRVQAKITDEKAIEKFLDGRYITFSAGSTTDRHVCSICNSDWAEGDMCEHRHGKIYDGDICVFITGKFEVLEGSVVNMPADDLSQVLSMELTDDNEKKTIAKISSASKDAIYFSDSVYNITERSMSEHVAEIAEPVVDEHVSPEPIIETVVESDTLKTIVGDFDGDTYKVTSEEKTSEEASVVEEGKAEEPTDLKDEVSEEAVDSVKANLEEDVKEATQGEASLEELEGLIGKLSAIVNKASKAKNKLSNKAKDGDSNDSVQTAEAQTKGEEKEEEEVLQDGDRSSEERVHEVDADSIVEGDFDWYLLEAGLALELGDAKLSSAQRKELNSSTFCGPDRSFPIPDCAHVTAARRLIGRAKLSSDQKARVLACVSAKAKKMGCGGEDNAGLQLAYDALKQDHVVVLKRLEQLEDKLRSTLERVAKHFDKEVPNSKELGNLLADTEVEEKSEADVEVKSLREARVENPSVASDAIELTARKKLGKYEKSIVDKYEKLLTKDGSDAAERYMVSLKRYLPCGFHPKKYIGD